MEIKIAPSVLSADFSQLASEVKKVDEAGADLIHWDIMDGHFVSNITFGPAVVKALKGKSKLPFDVHLMIEEPDKYIEQFVKAGSDLISVHVETCVHLQRTIAHIKELGAKAGVALNPATPLSAIDFVIEDLDFVLIMTVNPGFGGQKFIPTVLHKIRKTKEMIEKRGLSVEIEVDGGINDKVVPSVVKAGASILVAGYSVYGSKDVRRAIKLLREKARK